jgi:RHS repeat-associated protein
MRTLVENGTSSVYTVDQLNRETAIVHHLNGGDKRFDYAYNNVNDITLVKRDSGTGDGFSYDRMQQILAFQQNATVDINAGTISGGQTTTLEFDGCGNRTKLNGTPMATPNNMNQPTDNGIGHDNSGNMQTYDGWNFSYDAQNRLVSATKGSTTATFSYDAKNRQIARSINGVVTFSVWDDWELVEEYTTGNVRKAAYLQGAHGPVKSLLNDVYYFYQDSLGSTSHIAGANGQLIEYYKYDLYGKLQVWRNGSQVFTPPIVNDLFSGERWIPELGLYDLRNRYYSPDLGRFLQPDPIGFKGDASNLYRYCGNDWANRTDPMGLQAAAGDRRDQMRQPDYGCAEKNAESEIAFAASVDAHHVEMMQASKQGAEKAALEAQAARSTDKKATSLDKFTDRSLDNGNTLPTQHTATVTLYTGAHGYDHVGLGIDSSTTIGFYPDSKANSVSVGLGKTVAGEMHRDTASVVASHSIPISATQAHLMSRYQSSVTGNYNLYSRNCVTIAGNTLRAGGIAAPMNTIKPISFFDQMFGGH